MGIINSNKSIGNITTITCEGVLEVTLGVTAAPEIESNPTDIVLVLDRSGSMKGQPLADMKTGVNTFIDIIANATGGGSDEIGSGSGIGIISFSDTAVQDTGLITSVDDLKSATDGLMAGGLTNHGAAFIEAGAVLESSKNNKVIIMFTDGETTTGPVPASIAETLKAEGITIYCIGLVGDSGIDTNALNSWASDPDITHVAIAPDSSDLEQIFADLAANISLPGAVDIVIEEAVNPDFEIIVSPSASKGDISELTDTSFKWTIDQLGTTNTETATVTFSVRHIAGTTGTKHVDESISYSDASGNTVSFADPVVYVNCVPEISIDTCPVPVDINIDSCEDFVEYDAGDLPMEDIGRILQLDINLQNICPNKRVALAVIITELDQNGTAYPRGMKTITIPAHTRSACSDVLVKCIRFILPESLNVSGGTGTTLCEGRTVRAQFFAHYIDSNFQCCPANSVT